jgi:outer membrane immunogenic protein
MLRRTLVAFAGAIALMGGAFAAEPLPPPYLPPPLLPPPFSWDGFYIGVTAGYDAAWHHCDDLNNLDVLPETAVGCADQFRSYGFIGGGTLGYNWQKGSFVWGLETDFSGLTNRSSTSLSIPGACTPGTFQFELAKCGYGWQFSNSINWLWTVRPRIGLAVDRTLVYFTAGFALGGVQNSLWSTGSCGPGGCNFDEPFFAVTTGKTAIGYAVGGGLEYALTPNWSIKGEALYVNFESRTPTFTPLLGGVPTGGGFIIFPDGPFNIRWDNSLVLIRAGLNYRFNWAPVPFVAY